MPPTQEDPQRALVRRRGHRLSRRAPFVAMIATRGRTRWGLPKGAVSEGETSEQAALREVQEETGLDAEIVEPLDTIEYFFRAGDTLIKKSVDFYLMHYVGGSSTPQLSEVDDVEWVELSEAIRAGELRLGAEAARLRAGRSSVRAVARFFVAGSSSSPPSSRAPSLLGQRRRALPAAGRLLCQIRSRRRSLRRVDSRPPIAARPRSRRLRRSRTRRDA